VTYITNLYYVTKAITTINSDTKMLTEYGLLQWYQGTKRRHSVRFY